jgi:hypothetical protein
MEFITLNQIKLLKRIQKETVVAYFEGLSLYPAGETVGNFIALRIIYLPLRFEWGDHTSRTQRKTIFAQQYLLMSRLEWTLWFNVLSVSKYKVSNIDF